jgi:hypothetical protein
MFGQATCIDVHRSIANAMIRVARIRLAPDPEAERAFKIIAKSNTAEYNLLRVM